LPQSENFMAAEAGEWTSPEPGVTRRILVHSDEIMMVEVVFEAGAVGSAHSHPHIQTSYVAEGAFEVTIDGQTGTLEKGGSFIVPSNLVHGVRALSAARLIDVFNPHRAEFL
jgi:quercetin dioxygenase-like cupin family protein